ncbi:O-methylsterigmatocystin oxidoreductase [Rhizoctonia solani]|uniref:O-methylsterigmatocystin oxidoreductase n=1 Tax=Rhizoctonia solani TaxID=456999 RepID=A0A0K6FYV5_9AGAM|nr:O-methylsterigmatocystin oxidoreductase [Rhizoctonia solani]
MQLSKQLGSKIISLSVFGTTIVVLNDKDDAINLLDKRSAIYSDRTCPPLVQDPSLLNWGDFGSLIGYGDRWRRSVSETLLRSLYGYQTESSSDPFLVRSKELFLYLSSAPLPSKYLVNTLPSLRYVPAWCPGAGWKREVLEWRKEKESLINDIYDVGLENMKKDENSPLIVASLRNQALKLGLTKEEADEDVKQVSITLYGAGTETAVHTLLMLFLAMVLYPEVQRKAQAEIDSVIGSGRLPTFEDQARLGYVERLIQETLRWAPVTPLAVPHTCFRDDTYKGYHIPKGTIVMGNIWAMTRDETVYKDPEVFDPDRFLDPSIPPAPAFGWGRRRCPGVHFAESTLFIFVTSLLATFNIGIAQDENGEDIIPSRKMTNSLVLAPEEFPVKLTPRSMAYKDLVRPSF